MTGPEHYREAEQLLGYVQNSGPDPAGELIAAAQVHATLALAAATALNDGGGGMSTEDCIAWSVVASENCQPLRAADGGEQP